VDRVRGKAGGFRFSPKVDGNRVFTAAADGTITILDAAQRSARSRALDAGASSPPEPAGSGEW